MDVAECRKSAESYRLDHVLAGSILTQGKRTTGQAVKQSVLNRYF